MLKITNKVEQDKIELNKVELNKKPVSGCGCRNNVNVNIDKKIQEIKDKIKKIL